MTEEVSVKKFKSKHRVCTGTALSFQGLSQWEVFILGLNEFVGPFGGFPMF